MDGVHLYKRFQVQLLKISVSSAIKDTASDICDLWTFLGFKLHFTFQINVSGSQKSHIKVVVNTADGKIQFRMVCNDLVRRLALSDQRSDDLILFV